ncbi:DNA helicase II [Candidatus Nitrotoga sp. BS]|uniref:UvrD-helicase domain-containing protein n=1 Tax=Candidatus Nitrotoga sp. BS TaxID=2890408 RepID=UPI001EF2E05B|nr:UvrD-helicase domain-containing protein [Candidatus Nitrotoga sp. BS]CAH1201218.1 DNA helicase II [Candidatus Nitrotoga sp. BS]
MDFLSGLNPEQRAAVILPEQSALILAGAGSGKTRVLTTRIAWLISTGQVSPHGILAVTFTNKAAREMLLRLSAMLSINIRGLWMGTFHGLCNRMLRAHHLEAMLPQTFQILDSGDQLASIKRLMKALNVDDEKYPPREVQNFISKNKEQGLRAHEVEAFDPYTRRRVEIFAAYDEQCQREGVVDFSELLLRCYELLTRNQSLREHYQSRFRHILVDEFQDTNRLQYQWLKLLAGQHNALFAVGDDDQSIYAFRGANVGNMQELTRDFHVQNVIKLEQNYRSHGNILDAANALIKNNLSRLGKNLWTSENKGEPLRVYEAPTDAEEARFIAEEARQLNREGIHLAEMAVLYRSNAQSRVIEHALVSAGVAYRVYGGLRFFERQEIKHALAYLRLIQNSGDDNALLRIINFPTRGIGARTIEQLQEAARAQNISLWQAAKQTSGKVAAFVTLIEMMTGATRELPLPEAIDHILLHSGLLAHYQNETGVKQREAQERLENLNELINAATLFVHENEDDSLTSFLTHAALESGESQAEANADALHLMTVHSSKGLEFHTVFMGGLEEGLFPHQNSRMADAGVDEERRLMYVAITRARRRLYLSFAQSRMLHGQVNYSLMSSFLRELPEKLLHWITPRIATRNNFSSPAYSTAFVPKPPPINMSGLGAKKCVSVQNSPWHISQEVHHAKFGEGVIIDIEGGDSDMRVQVKFRTAGTKWLALEYAKLTPL